MSIGTGKVSPGPTFIPGCDTDPLPATATSCATTPSFRLRMRLELVLRSESDMCRSISSAEPRDIARDSPVALSTSTTGESFPKTILTELLESGVSWASIPAGNASAANSTRIVALLKIYLTHGHVTRHRISILRLHRTLRAGRKLHAFRAAVHQSHRRVADSVRPRFYGCVLIPRCVLRIHHRPRPLQYQTGNRQRRDARHRHRHAPSGPPRRPSHLLHRTHALARRQPQPDVGAHLFRDPAPRPLRHFQ